MIQLNKKILFASIAFAVVLNDMQAQNVGIGTATPSEKLHVVGGTRITSLSGVGNRMVITDANGVLSTQAIPAGGGTLTGVTAGDGLTGGGVAGNPTLDVVAVNGLTTNANDIRLGGALIQNTEITQGTFSMTYNLDNTGDFQVQSAGTNKFTVLDNGNSEFGGDVTWRDNTTGTGTILAQLIDDGNDGRFTVLENGIISIDLNANGTAIFNQQGLDRDFRVESNNNANMFRINAGTDRIGIGTAAPTETIHVVGGARITSLTGVGNRMVISDATGVLSTQAIPAGTDDQNLTSATLAGSNLTIAIENGNPAVVNLASLNEAGRNGLRSVGNFIHLGGPLTENTVISQAGFSLDVDLTGTGDFTIQDNGVDKFTVLDIGSSRFGGDVEWRDNNTAGTILAQLTDDGDDGRFRILENGNVSVDLDANTQFIFNEQGLDRNFRVESDANANMLFLDAGNNRIGMGTGAPSEALHLVGTARITEGVTMGTSITRGVHTVAIAAAAPSIQFGNTVFNDVESGRLTFEENTPSYKIDIADYCGFQIHNDGAANTLSFGSDCGTGINIMTMERGGDVGIATNNPNANLSVNGDANKTGGGTWAVFSDRRLKKDISDFTEGLDFIKKVRAVNFSYNDKMAEIWGENPRTKDKVYQGVIAQELQEIAPDMVREVEINEGKNPEDYDYDPSLQKESETFLEVDPNKFTYALINAVKEQQAMIEQLKAEQANTKKELTVLKALLEK